MEREKIKVFINEEYCHFIWKDVVYEVPRSRYERVIDLINKESDKYNRLKRKNVIGVGVTLGSIIVTTDADGKDIYQREYEKVIYRILDKYSDGKIKPLDAYYKWNLILIVLFLNIETSSLYADIGTLIFAGFITEKEERFFFVETSRHERQVLEDMLKYLEKIKKEKIYVWNASFDIPLLISRC